MITKKIKPNNIENNTLVDMHIHTNYSPDSMMTLEQTLIELQGFVNAITVTDHNIISFVPDLILNSYEEKYQIKTFTSSVEISTMFGDILAYGITSIPSINLHPKEIIAIIHSEGGIVAAAHPFDPLGLGDLIYELDLDAIEINGSRFRDANAIAKEAAVSIGLPCIGGSDSHHSLQVGTCVTKFPSPVTSLKDIISLIKKKQCGPVFLKH